MHCTAMTTWCTVLVWKFSSISVHDTQSICYYVGGSASSQLSFCSAVWSVPELSPVLVMVSTGGGTPCSAAVTLWCCRLDVGQFKDLRKEDFLEKYTSLVQRLSLLLLQVCMQKLSCCLTGCQHQAM